jgi:hypothetical protein
MITQQRQIHAAKLGQILDFRPVSRDTPRFKAKN